MKRMSLHSASLKSAGYSGHSHVLELEFQDGHVYQYLEVPRSVFDHLLKAISKGIYFLEPIKGRLFRKIS